MGSARQLILTAGLCVLVWAGASRPASAGNEGGVAAQAAVLDAWQRANLEDTLFYNRHRVQEQADENDSSYRTAATRQKNLVQQGEALYQKRRFREAKRCYLEAINVTCRQWVFGPMGLGEWGTTSGLRFREDAAAHGSNGAPLASGTGVSRQTVEWSGGQSVHYVEEVLLPATVRNTVPVATSYAMVASSRLDGIDRLIAEDDLQVQISLGEQDLKMGRLSDAYRRLALAKEGALHIQGSALADKRADELSARLEDIVSAVSKPLDDAEAALVAGHVDDAIGALSRFNTRYAKFRERPDIQTRYRKLAADPGVRKGLREQEAERLLDLAQQAFAGEKVANARDQFAAVAKSYADTKAGQLAGKRLLEIQSDRATRDTALFQEIERGCRDKLARARGFMAAGRYQEAAGTCDEIIREFPESPWTDEAALLADEAQAGLADNAN